MHRAWSPTIPNRTAPCQADAQGLLLRGEWHISHQICTHLVQIIASGAGLVRAASPGIRESVGSYSVSTGTCACTARVTIRWQGAAPCSTVREDRCGILVPPRMGEVELVSPDIVVGAGQCRGTHDPL